MRSVSTASVLATIFLVLTSKTAHPAEAPTWLPRYDVAINLDVGDHRAVVTQQISWVNRHQRPTRELVFNVHSAYEPPTRGIDYLVLAKMLEIMRVPAHEAIYRGRPLNISKVGLRRRESGIWKTIELAHAYREDIPTALVVTLPEEVAAGESVTITIEFEFDIPQKQGRWGQWKGITVLSNWLPVLAYYDEKGWQPTPYISWHQPFFNEAGVYNVHLRLATDQKVAMSGSVRKKKIDGDHQELFAGPVVAREFSIVASDRFEEQVAKTGDLTIKCLAVPEHEHNAKAVVNFAVRAMETYSQWFGAYPNKELVFVESYFGWNGNECSGLIMIDERVFNMPRMAQGFIEYLVSHETCHQWFYNVLGTDGYRETFMDEAFANYFAHRLLNEVRGRNNPLFDYPKEYSWLPNIRRDDFRYSQFYGTVGRGELEPPLLEMPKYKHVVNLFSAAADRGSKIVGMIEQRLGEAAFFDFMRGLYAKYYFRVIFADDLQRELEAYTGQSWDEFFRNWLHDSGLTDWSLESANVQKLKNGANAPYQAVVYLKQKAEYDEPTTLGFRFDDSEHFQLRIPVDPKAGTVAIDNPPTRIEALPDHRIRVEVMLPAKPTQITVDPDQVLPDKNPTNNNWKGAYRFHVTPFYTFLDETDLTAAYDRWNITVGPWFYGPSYSDPWFTRTDVIGVRAGAFRTQQFAGGVYTGYRTDYRDLAAGFDAQWLNPFFPKTEVGIHGEKNIAILDSNSTGLDRAVGYYRYLFEESASLYTAPMHYVEGFVSHQHNFLPTPRNSIPGSENYTSLSQIGVHYHADYLTPYWNAETGFKFDLTYAAGLPILGQPHGTQQVMSQLSWVHGMPDGLGYFSRTRLAYRMYGAVSTPTDANLYSLGGNLLFRGFDMRERQGSSMWIGSLEWRLPIVEDVEWDALGHGTGLRNFFLAPFYDTGDIYAMSKAVGPVAQAVGLGIRAEIAWLSFIERSTLRLDIAKAIGVGSAVQMWVGIMHPF